MSEKDDAAERPVTVRSHKYDGSVHRVWTAALVRVEGSLVVLEGRFAEEVRHPLLGHIKRGTLSTEFYWTDRWYSIFRFREPSGELRNYYCNVNAPATFDGSVLDFVDLDVDVLVAPDFSCTILDEEEFASNAVRFGYPADFHERAERAIAELHALIDARRFPFDVTA